MRPPVLFISLLAAACLNLPAAHADDFDADGLPDDWEAQYGFSTNGLPNPGLPASALMGWWQMDANSADVLDRSDNELTGARFHFETSPVVAGLFSNALAFTTNSYVSFDPNSAALDLTNSFTVSLWFWSTNNTEETTLVEWGSLNTNLWELSIATNGVARFRFADPDANVQTVMDTNAVFHIRDGQWHHLAGVFNHLTSNAWLYVDGAVAATAAVTNWAPAEADYFALGIIETPPPNEPFLLDEVRLYRVALSGSDILQLPNTHYDPDGDGWTNLEEYQHFTHPLNRDTDGDGIDDSIDPDNDNDGLGDAWEIQWFGDLSQGANDDPDGDGVSNLIEFLHGRNPTKGAVADPGGAVNLVVFTVLE